MTKINPTPGKPQKPNPKQVKELEELIHKLFRHKCRITSSDGTTVEKVLTEQELWNVRKGITVKIEALEEQKPTAADLEAAAQMQSQSPK